jgi:T-complex protein 1 subunit beta
MDKGSIGSMRELGVTESYKLKRQVVLSASEAAEMIIRYDSIYAYFLTGRLILVYSVDDILRAAPRRREAV